MFKIKSLIFYICILSLFGIETKAAGSWLLIDNFETNTLSAYWQVLDPDNQTDPFIENPQIFELQKASNNQFVLKKPAAEGIIGNRKALSFYPLPTPIPVGEVYTFYTRINIESFPNNHSFGLSGMDAVGIERENYNAFEPMIRITDKAESDGSVNDGTLMVSTGHKSYSPIRFELQNRDAHPLKTDVWYELWYVVNNGPKSDNGQRFKLYMKGGEFTEQTLVAKDAAFRMQREQPLINFITISNTGPKRAPYGNGGVRYDDLYMAQGTVLTNPIHNLKKKEASTTDT